MGSNNSVALTVAFVAALVGLVGYLNTQFCSDASDVAGCSLMRWRRCFVMSRHHT